MTEHVQTIVSLDAQGKNVFVVIVHVPDIFRDGLCLLVGQAFEVADEFAPVDLVLRVLSDVAVQNHHARE